MPSPFSLVAVAAIASFAGSGCVLGELESDDDSTELTGPLHDMAYAGILRSNGKWTCMIESPDATCPAGNTGAEAVPGILAAKPRFVRTTNAGELVCREGGTSCPRDKWLVGIPDKGTPEWDALVQLKNANIKLGIHINGKSRTPDQILEHARRIRERDKELADLEGRPRFYDWIQVDFAFERAKRDTDRTKVDKIFKGLNDQGWLVWANQTGWAPGYNEFLGRGVWVHAKRFELIRKLRDACTDADNKIINSAQCDVTVNEVSERALDRDLDGNGQVAGGGDVLLDGDRAFLKTIRTIDPGANAMLKLEIYGQINVFKRKLTPQVQRALFFRWAALQDCVKVDGRCERFKMFYPLAVPNAGDGEGEKGQTGTPITFHPYVSWRPEAETFCQIKAAIERFDPPVQGQPAAQCTAPNGQTQPVYWN